MEQPQLKERSKQLTTIERINSVRHQLELNKAELVKALPTHIDANKAIRVVVNDVTRNPALLDCEPTSFYGAIMEAAAMGLEIGSTLGLAYLVPFGRTVTMIPGYKGILKLAKQSESIADIYAYPIFEGDEYEIEMGDDPKIKHWPKFESDNAIAYYAVVRFTDGNTRFEIMGKKAVEKHRDKFAKAKNVWASNFDEMARKTVLKRICKSLPAQIDLPENLAAALEAENVIDTNFAEPEKLVELSTTTDADYSIESKQLAVKNLKDAAAKASKEKLHEVVGDNDLSLFIEDNDTKRLIAATDYLSK